MNANKMINENRVSFLLPKDEGGNDDEREDDSVREPKAPHGVKAEVQR
jgi:hypothetical protein